MIQRAVIHVQSSGRDEVTGANVLVALFSERESHAAYFLQEQDMTRYDAVNFIGHGIAKRPGLSEPRPVQGADEEPSTATKRRAEARSGEALDSLLRQPQQEGAAGQGRSADRPRAPRSSAPSRSCAAAPRTTRCLSAIPASARPRSPRAWRARSSTATCRKCWPRPPSSRSTWARCSPAPAIAATSRSG